VTQDLLYHPDVGALREQERGNGVAGVVHAGLTPLRLAKYQPPPVRCGHSRAWLVQPFGQGFLTAGQVCPRLEQPGPHDTISDG
jgi:hypothetical protein